MNVIGEQKHFLKKYVHTFPKGIPAKGAQRWIQIVFSTNIQANKELFPLAFYLRSSEEHYQVISKDNADDSTVYGNI